MFFGISSSRFEDLHRATEALIETGVAPVGVLKNGTVYPLGYTDDLGIYTIIPYLSKWFTIDPARAIWLFFFTLLLVVFCSFLTAELYARRSWWMSGFALLAATMGSYLLCRDEVPYTIGGIVSLMLVP